MSNALSYQEITHLQGNLPTSPGRILIAEDDPVVAASMTQDVRELGYTVVGPASNGGQAIELAKCERPDLALLDIRMPVIGGFGAATVLSRHMDIPVVMVSAYTELEYLDAGQRVGVFGYLIKPITIEHLRFGIAVAWARYRDRQRLRGQVRELKIAIQDRKDIERAKGILMDKLGLNERNAMRRLQKQARNARRRLADTARAIVESDKLFSEIDGP